MSSNIITLEEINSIVDILNKIYDFVRVVKPLRKKVVNFSDGVLKESQHHCYDFWSNGKICSNCISMRAFNLKDTFFKLDWVGNKLYMVLAIPIQDAAETVVLEILKEVTNSVVVEIPEDMKNNSLLQTLNEFGQMQIKDGLTGIYNRRFIDERLPSDILNSSIDLTPFAIIFADIDRFKLVNDTYGHVAGDHVLKQFAGLLQNSVVDSVDWVARYGGEEFLICLRNKDFTSTVDFAEKLRNEVQNHVFNYEGSNIKITSSFGVCCLNKAWDIKIEELIEYADKNLYAAKAGGRNKVVASEI